MAKKTLFQGFFIRIICMHVRVWLTHSHFLASVSSFLPSLPFLSFLSLSSLSLPRSCFPAANCHTQMPFDHNFDFVDFFVFATCVVAMFVCFSFFVFFFLVIYLMFSSFGSFCLLVSFVLFLVPYVFPVFSF